MVTRIPIAGFKSIAYCVRLLQGITDSLYASFRFLFDLNYALLRSLSCPLI